MRRSFASPLLAAMLVAGCAAAGPGADVPPLEGTAWVLAALPGSDLVAGAPATLRFEPGRVTGSDGCNRYGGSYTAQGGALAFTPGGMASTRMACPTAVTAQADAFMAALAAARAYRVEGQRLLLLAADGSLRATLAAQSQALAGTRWRVTAIHNGQGAVASLVAGSTVTLAFDADGRASGSAGCNGFSAGYVQSGTQLRFQPAATARRMCPGDALMQQELAFLRALEGVATMRLEGARLELRTGSGALALALERDDKP